MHELIPVLDRAAIDERVARLARQISSDYRGQHLVMIGVLKGAFIFMADLVRQIEVERLTLDFVRASSYGCHTESSGCVRVTKDIEVDIQGKDVIIVEDILDSGLTAAFLVQHLHKYQPNSIKLCAFIDKQERRKVDLQADYVGYTVKEGFLVGYGLDFAEAFRNLYGLYHLKQA